MRSFTLPQIQALHDEEVAKMQATIAADRQTNEEIGKQIQMLEKQRELERRIYWSLKGRGKGDGNRDGDKGGDSRGVDGEVMERKDGDREMG